MPALATHNATADVQRLQEHAEQLRAELDAFHFSLDADDWRQSCSLPLFYAFWAPDVTSEVTYWAWLHELGHIACQHIRRDSCIAATQRREAEAWEWAFDHAAIDLGADAAMTLMYALETYEYQLTKQQMTPTWVGAIDPMFEHTLTRFCQPIEQFLEENWDVHYGGNKDETRGPNHGPSRSTATTRAPATPRQRTAAAA